LTRYCYLSKIVSSLLIGIQARKYTLPHSGVPRDVYVVLRVFYLQQPSTNFVAYIDPWGMYLARELNFRAGDKFVVTPAVG
jgi:hypothetical protein